MQTYKGACHCGDVRFEVQGDFSTAIECNCSMCSKKGTILSFTSPENFKLVSGENSLSKYNFYKMAIDHTFCKTCGVTPFLSGRDPHGNVMKAINVRCLENFDVKALEIKQVDGRSF